ncbi:hypothetical protein WDU94_009829 [Cyamophila willieti]
MGQTAPASLAQWSERRPGADTCDEPPVKKPHLEETATITQQTPGAAPVILANDDKKPGPGHTVESGNMASVASAVGGGVLPNPLKWTVTEVCDFVRNLPGYAEYVEDFSMQEIDGQALMLLKPKHLMQNMSMKLGPALKIVSVINSMRQAAEGTPGVGDTPTPASSTA